MMLAYITAAVLGLVMGSFLATCTIRLPLDHSLVRPGSTCPSCRSVIAKYDLIPVFSYLFLGGRSRCCNTRIGLRYPVMEILTALIFAGLVHHYGPGWDFFVAAVFASFLLVVAVIDLDYHLIFNKMTYPAIVLSVVAAVIGHAGIPGETWMNRLVASLLGAAALYLVFLFMATLGRLLLRGEVLGQGDVKLAAVIGAYFSFWKAAEALLLGFVVAGMVSLVLLILGRVRLKTQTAFGPYLVIGALLVLLGFTIGRNESVVQELSSILR